MHANKYTLQEKLKYTKHRDGMMMNGTYTATYSHTCYIYCARDGTKFMQIYCIILQYLSMNICYKVYWLVYSNEYTKIMVNCLHIHCYSTASTLVHSEERKVLRADN